MICNNNKKWYAYDGMEHTTDNLHNFGHFDFGTVSEGNIISQGCGKNIGNKSVSVSASRQ